MSEKTKKPSLVERFRSLTPKQKQYVVLAGVGTVFMALVLGSVTMWDRSPRMLPQTAAKSEAKQKNIAVPGQQVDPKDVWMAQSSSRLQAMDDMMRTMQQKIDQNEKMAKEQQANAQGNTPGGAAAGNKSILPALPPLNPPKAEGTPTAPPKLPPLSAPEAPKAPSIASFEISKVPVEETAKQTKTYIPSGSFARVSLLGGFDAPAGGQAQHNPIPVIMRVKKNAVLPNRYRAQVKECHVIGLGHGDISSERAYIRTNSLSCVLKSGEVVDADIKGYVVGEDGKAGMRGRLISKQGQVLANSLATGVISGFGQGLQQASTTYSTSAFGTVGSVSSTGDQMRAGIGTGIGNALDRLSKYYITLAEKMFPVIEIDAAREVDVVLTKGVRFVMTAESGNEYSDVWRKGRQIQNKNVNPKEDYR